MLVDVGVEQPALLRDKQHVVGERLTLQVVKAAGQVEVQPANRVEMPDYWGYRVTVERGSLKRAVAGCEGGFGVGHVTKRQRLRRRC